MRFLFLDVDVMMLFSAAAQEPVLWASTPEGGETPLSQAKIASGRTPKFWELRDQTKWRGHLQLPAVHRRSTKCSELPRQVWQSNSSR